MLRLAAVTAVWKYLLFVCGVFCWWYLSFQVLENWLNACKQHYKYFIFCQEKLLGLMSLPTKDQYEELKKRRLHMVRQVKICYILYQSLLQGLKPSSCVCMNSCL